MSAVASVILAVSCIEEGFDALDRPTTKLDMLNSFLECGGHHPLASLTDHFAGYKHPQTSTFGGAYNFLDCDAFLAVLAAFEWDEPESAVCLIKEEANPFIVWRPRQS